MIYISIKSGGLTQSAPVEISDFTRDVSALLAPRPPPPRSRQHSEARRAEGDQDQRWSDLRLLLHHQLQRQGTELFNWSR